MVVFHKKKKEKKTAKKMIEMNSTLILNKFRILRGIANEQL